MNVGFAGTYELIDDWCADGVDEVDHQLEDKDDQ